MIKQWLYVGCGKADLHALFTRGIQRSFARESPYGDQLQALGTLQPEIASKIAITTRLESWGATALSFVTPLARTTVILAPSLSIEPIELLKESRQRFPEVFSRLPQLTLVMGPDLSLYAEPLTGPRRLKRKPSNKK